MKKIIITLLLAVTLMLGVTACSSKEEPKPATTPEVTKAEVTEAPTNEAEPTAEPTSVEPATTDIEPVNVTPEVTAEPTPTEIPTEWTFTEEELFNIVEPVTEDYMPERLTSDDVINRMPEIADETDIEANIKRNAIIAALLDRPSLARLNDIYHINEIDENLIDVPVRSDGGWSVHVDVNDKEYTCTLPEIPNTYAIVIAACDEDADAKTVITERLGNLKNELGLSTNKILRTNYVDNGIIITSQTGGNIVVSAKDILNMTDIREYDDYRAYAAIVVYKYVDAIDTWAMVNPYSTISIKPINTEMIDAYYTAE